MVLIDFQIILIWIGTYSNAYQISKWDATTHNSPSFIYFLHFCLKVQETIYSVIEFFKRLLNVVKNKIRLPNEHVLYEILIALPLYSRQVKFQWKKKTISDWESIWKIVTEDWQVSNSSADKVEVKLKRENSWEFWSSTCCLDRGKQWSNRSMIQNALAELSRFYLWA